MKTKSLYANSTLQKIDKLDRLTVQMQNAQDEIDRLKAAIKADLSVLKAENLIPAYDAGVKLFKAARDGNLMKDDCFKCQHFQENEKLPGTGFCHLANSYINTPNMGCDEFDKDNQAL